MRSDPNAQPAVRVESGVHVDERCSICGCRVHRSGTYAKPTVTGRSHATKHHHVAERFFGRSRNRGGAPRDRVFQTCPWGLERKASVFCYECHELLLHNPVLLPADVERFAQIVRRLRLDEDEKSETVDKLAGRVRLLHRVIEAGLEQLEREPDAVLAADITRAALSRSPPPASATSPAASAGPPAELRRSATGSRPGRRAR